MGVGPVTTPALKPAGQQDVDPLRPEVALGEGQIVEVADDGASDTGRRGPGSFAHVWPP